MKEEVRALARRLLDDFPETPESLDVVGLLHLRLDRVDQAERCWRRCLELEPRFAPAHFALGLAARQKTDYAAAAGHFRGAAELDPQSRQIPYELADALIKQGDLDRAQAVVENNLQADPAFFPSLYQLGQIHSQRKDYAKARKVLEAAIRYGPDFAATYFALSTACSRLGDSEAAGRHLATFRKLRARDEQSHLADLRSQDDGLAGMRRIAAETHTAASRVYLAYGQAVAAEALLLRACQIDPAYVDCADSLAQFYEQQGRADEALKIVGQASAASPTSIALLVRSGTLAAKLGKPDEAERAYQKAIAVSPGQAKAYAMLADLYLQTNRKLPEAKRLAQKAVELQPDPALYRLLSVACEKTGAAAGARAAAEKALGK